MAADAPGSAREGLLRRGPLRSVRGRITAAAMVVVGIALAVTSATLVALVRDSLVSSLDEGTELVADDLENKLADGILPEVIAVPGGADDDDLLIQVLDSNRRVVAVSENLVGRGPVVPRQPDPDSDGTLRITVERMPVDSRESFRVFGRRVTVPSGEIVTLYVATEMAPVRSTVADLHRAVTVGGPLLLLLAGMAVWMLVGRALRPVEGIRRQVAEISEAALDRRVPEPPHDDEVGRLARTMNAMLGRLQRSAERQGRFVADASHELRSPLAATRTTLEVALAHPGSTTWEAAAGDVLAETERMERLVDDLLFLARGDEGQLRAAPGPVDLDDIIGAEANRTRARGRVGIDTSDVGAAQVRGVGAHLERVVRNLLENAEIHARSAVSVSLTRDGRTVVLAVTDDGPGIAAADRERIFDRFVRLEEARARHGGGAGLGLAIAREIVAAHGGTITAEDAPGGGARFVVRLPAGR
ncbi:MAG: ATP-binding protein [Actinomycetota bacterium]|nr:ATP-binding protein [Actinomycetota bacterium]